MTSQDLPQNNSGPAQFPLAAPNRQEKVTISPEKIYPLTFPQTRLRSSFTEAATLYSLHRPSYPTPLITTLSTLTSLTPNSHILEIGPGTGQATLPLAQTGCHILGIELGSEMAAVARKNLSAYPNVEIVVSSFEDWDLQGREKSFDFVVSATAFHWVDEKVRMLKAADALRDGDGALAVISTHHVKGGSEGFFAEVQPFYERCGLAASFGMCLPAASNIAEDASEFERSGRFGPVEFRRYEWDEIYSTGEYLGLLLTYSNHRCLEEGARKELFDSIAELIDGKYQGRISKRYMAQLALAKKLC